MFGYTPAEVHAGVEVAFVIFLTLCFVLMAINARNLYIILRRSEADREAREKAVHELRLEAAALADKTRRTVESHEQHLMDIHTKIDENTEITKDAARVSGEALSAANSMNEKIQATQERLLEVAKGTVVNIDLNKEKPRG